MTNTSHRRSWRVAAHSHKLQQKTKLALVVLSLLIFSLGFSKLIVFVKNFRQPLSSDQLHTKNYSWDRQSNVNLVLQGQDIAMLTYKPAEKEVFLIKIPASSYLEVPRNLGHWPISSVFDLGQSLKPPAGSLLLKASVSNLLGLPIDGFLKSKTQTCTQLLGNLRKNPLKTFPLLPSLQTDLSLPELIFLEWGLSVIRFDKVQIFDLAQLNLMEKTQLPDGTQVLIADPIKIDSLMVQLGERTFRQESLTIAIYNATEAAGLAGKAGRIVTNLGGNVIIVSSLTDSAQSGVYPGMATDQEIQSTATFKRLVQIFGEGAKIPPAELTSSRAQINIVLGEDFAQRF